MSLNVGNLTAEQQLQIVYTGYYGRAGEPNGFEFWLGLLEENLDGDADGVPGMSLGNIATEFFNQAETRAVYELDPDVTSTADLPSASSFLVEVYQNLFDRVPEPEGLQFWSNVLEAGTIPVGEIILEIVKGAQGSDGDALMNKVEAGLDWKDSAAAAGVEEVNPAADANDPNYDAAVAAVDSVDEDPASLAAAKTATDQHFNEAPVAANEFDSTNEDTVLNGDVDDESTDPDGDTLTHTVEEGDGPANGSVVMNADGTYTYTPNADFNGTDTFAYTVDDGKGGVDTGTVTVTVNAVNDAPVAQTGIVSTTDEDNSVSGSVTSSDVDGGTPTYSVDTGSANGSVTMNPDGTYTYTPDADFNGTDSFTYMVSDGNGGTDTATVNVTVNAVDDAPVAEDESASVDEDAFILNGQLDADDIDNNNNNITFALNAAAPAGLALLADGSYTFDASVPAYQSLAEGETQDVTAGYTVTSNGKSDTGMITVTVTGTNDAPVAQAASASTVEDTAISGTLSATDVDNDDTLTYSLATGASNGDVTVNQNGSFVYDPNPYYNGVDSFTYTVTDSEGATSTATVNIGISAVDDVLTSGVDNIQGGQGDDVVIGNENTLNAGDSIVGGDGEDTLVVNVNADSALNFAGFEAHVETFRTTIDGSGSATFDMSGSEITGNTFINTNSTADVTYDRVNMNPDGPDADSRPQLDVELRNVTQGAATTFTTRPADVTGSQDEANVLMTNLDNNAHIGALSFYGTPGGTDASGLEFFDLSTEGSPLPVFLDDLNTPGGHTVNIDTDVALTIGDTDIPGNVSASSSFDQITGAAGGSLTGIDNALSSGITTVNATAGNGDVTLSVNANASGVTGTFGGGNDVILGGTGNDNFSGGEGNDFLVGDEGNDTLFGEGGNDTLLGDGDSVTAGNDLLEGGAGNDLLIGFGGDDILRGGDDNDTLMGGDGDDLLEGGDGDDVISTGAASDASDETVDAGAGSDTVYTRGEELQGRAAYDTDPLNILDQLSGGTDGAGPDAAGNDVLNIVGSSADTRGLNDVTEFEQINLSGGTFTYVIGDSGSSTDTTAFETDHDSGNSGPTIISGKEANPVDIDASTLDNGIGLAGGDSNDTLIGGAGDDTIAGDADSAGSNGGSDNLVGNDGNDTFIFDAFELTTNDTVSGGANDDTILIEERLNPGSGTVAAAVLGDDISSIENLVLADTYSAFSGQLEGTSGDLSGSATVTLDSTFNNVGQNNTLNIDATALDQPGEVFTLNSDETNADLDVTGGSNGDTFNMGDNLTVLDTIDGADGEDTLTINSNAGGDADFTNVANVETLKLDATFSGTLTLGTEASGAGFNVIDASMVTGDITIDASDFGRAVTIIDGDGNSTIIGPDDDPLTLQMGGGDDTITTGTADDVIQIDNGDLTFNDVITDNGGDDTVEFQNMAPINEGGIAAGVDLDNVTGVESYTFAGDGDIPNDTPANGGIDSDSNAATDDDDADAHSLTFEGGTVGTVTDIAVDGATVTDGRDSLEVVIGGTDNGLTNVDVDYRFTIDGTAGDDRLYKANNGLNNQIVFNGGEGSDTVSIFDGDLGATTTIDGGSGTDWLSQTGGSWTDDDFINVSNTEGLTAESPLVATLGANAAAAGINQIVGTGPNFDDVVILDAAFDDDPNFGQTLSVDMDQVNGGNDSVDASATETVVTFNYNDAGAGSDIDDLNGDDTLKGGASEDDVLNLHFINSGDSVDLDNVSGVETINITEAGNSSSTYTVNLGDMDTDATDDEVTINQSGFEGETLIVNAGNHTGNLIYNGEPNSGADSVTSGTGDDTLNGGGDDDTLTSGDGEDEVNGGTGNDLIDSGDGDDIVTGGAGEDTITAGSGDDSVDGGANDDTIDGGAGNDRLNGDGGDDLITGGAGQDTLDGGTGANDFRYTILSDSQGTQRDTINSFQSGTDEILIESNVLVQAGGATTLLDFVGNAPDFSDASGDVSLPSNAGDGEADIVYQQDTNKVWIDLDDNGILNGQDLQITVNLAAGDTLQASDFRLVDTIAPAAPTIDTITDDTGASGSDFITSDNGSDGTDPVVRVSFNTTATDGTAAMAGDTLVFGAAADVVNNSTIGGNPANGYALTAGDITNGYVDITLNDGAGDLDDDTYNLSVAIDDGTNTGDAATQDVVIDSSTPATPAVALNSDTGQSASDEITNDNQVDVTGLEGGSTTWEYSLDAGATWTAGTGSSFDLTDDTVFAAGDVQVRQTDAAGNTSGVGSNAVPWEEDSTAPAAPTISLNDDSGTSGTDNITNDNQVDVAGLEVSATWEYSLDGGTSWNTGTGSSFNMASDTTYATGDLQVRQTDVAGNTSAVGSNTNVWVEDSTAPSTSTLGTIFYNSTGGTGNGFIEINGTFDTSNTVDATQLSISDGGTSTPLVATDIDSVTVTATQIVVNLTSAGLTTIQTGEDMGSTNDPVIDLASGFFTDLAGNASGTADHNHIGLNIKASDDGLTTLFGNSFQTPSPVPFDDTFELDNSGVQVTGFDGADTFLITEDGTNDFSVAGATIGDINDFDSSEGDLIQFQAADLNSQLAGTPYAANDDGSKVFFQTFENGTVITESGVGGTFIYDATNEQLRFDVDGQTSFNGSAVDPTGSADDLIIDLTGISTSGFSASDIEII